MSSRKSRRELQPAGFAEREKWIDARDCRAQAHDRCCQHRELKVKPVRGNRTYGYYTASMRIGSILSAPVTRFGQTTEPSQFLGEMGLRVSDDNDETIILPVEARQ